MTEREKLMGCLQSFFRSRHGMRQRFKKSKRWNEMESVFRRNSHMVRIYIRRIRALDSEG